MVESTTFEANILERFEQEYNGDVAQKAVDGYKLYLEECDENGFNFKIIEQDISGKDEDPSQSRLYCILLKSLQTNDTFQTKEAQRKLYLLIVSIVNGILLSCLVYIYLSITHIFPYSINLFISI